ncbi:MAG: rod shape-determining protein [Deltaproteobacteria bacterium]|nr:rod shape-determining protein [Deltaproteobacteria bacterium]
MLESALGMFSSDLAIDLGTANTLVYATGRGLVVDEPSVVATQKGPGTVTGKVLAVGAEAKRMVGRTPGNIVAIRPLKDGVIADFDTTESMLRYFIQQALGKRSVSKPRVVVCIPFGITEVEKRAVQESARSAGAREVLLVSEPLAAAIGAGLPVTEPVGSMIVDIGGGTTEVAVISLGGIATSQSLRVAGDAMDEAIAAYVKRRFNCLIGERTAEDVKLAVGCAAPPPSRIAIRVRGRDLSNGTPREFELTGEDTAEALSDSVAQIIEAVRSTLERTPPELAADIIDQGIVLAGGGSQLRHLDEVLRDATGLPVVVAEDPLRCVVMGAGECLERPELLKRVAL